jgi:8-oxo-dGTP diphosphatase
LKMPNEAQRLAQDDTGLVVPVLAAVINERGKYLVCKRPASKRHGGLWEFPGGKREPGETRDAAAHRELGEELGVQVEQVGEVLLSVRDPGSIYLIEFTSIAIRGEPAALEHDELRWCTVDELRALALAPSDLTFANECLQQR